MIYDFLHQLKQHMNIYAVKHSRYLRPDGARDLVIPPATPDGTPIETSHHENHAAAYDWDSDGRLDLMIGGESGTIYLFHRDWLSGITHRVKIRQ